LRNNVHFSLKQKANKAELEEIFLNKNQYKQIRELLIKNSKQL
jgi:hypothetical protein